MKYRIVLSVCLVLTLIYITFSSNSSGFGGSSSSCSGSGCHSPNGSTTVSLLGIPSPYTPGQTYTVTLTVFNPAYTMANARAGFKLSSSAGSISGNPLNTTLTGLNLRHNTPQLLSGGTTSWNFNWTAPASGAVTFNIAGNATNGDGGSGGDAWNSTSTTILAATATSAPSIQSISATGITSTGATINAQVNPNNSSVTSIQVQYGLTASYGSTVTMTPSTMTGSSFQSTNATLSSLLSNTLYHYRIVAINGIGTTNSPDFTFTTALAASAPSIQSISATGITSTGATINAQVNPNNSNVSNIQVEYGLTTAYGSIATMLPNTMSGATFQNTNTALSGLLSNTLYHYRITAINGIGTTNSIDFTFTTAVATSAPSIQAIAATGITFTGATINAQINPNNSNVTNVQVEYGLTSAYGNSAIMSPSTMTGSTFQSTSVTLSGLLPNTLYHYRVVAINGVGTTNSADSTFATLNNTSLVNIKNINISTFPNPFTNKIVIGNKQNYNIQNIELFNILGEKVDIVYCKNANDYTIYTSNFISGSYILKLKINNFWYSQQLTKL